jgi:hypothetical protein
MWHGWKTGQVHTGFWCRHLREIDHLQDLDVDGRIILKSTFKKSGGGGMDWIDLAQDMDRWQALVNATKNFHVP